MIFFLYNLILLLSLLVLSPIILFKVIFDKRYRIGLSERLGNIPDKVVAYLKNPPSPPFAKGGDSEERPIWFHAASVGEIIASQKLLEGIRERFPGRRLLVSTFTPTGYMAAREKLKADGVIFLPLDFPWAVNRAVKKINPSVLILMETELWPNLIRKAGSLQIPVVVVNGRISDRSYGKYWFISPLLKKVFESVTLFLMQSEGDAGRIITLGAERSKVTITGNIKFDLKPADRDIRFIESWGGPVLLAGSTHKGEDAPILDIYKGLRERYHELKLVLAPRHLDRVGEVEGILNEKGLQYVKRSEVSEKIDSPILLLDTLGELASFYKYGTIVFIGGTLIPVGGHNPLEPALYGKPVLFGPHMENFRESARILEESGGGARVDNPEALKVSIERLLSDESLRQTMGNNARQAVLKNQGATERTMEALSSEFTTKVFSRQPLR